MARDQERSPALRFLIVEDEISARETLRQIVSNNPVWSVIAEATNGLETIAKMEHQPDVVLMDVVMPVMDGLEATRRIKSCAPDTIVVLTTAYQNRAFRTRSLEAGADGFILKDDLTTDALEEIIADASRKGENHG